MHVNYGPGFGLHGSEFNSFCVDLDHMVSVGQVYQVTPRSTSDGLPSGGMIAFLYNKYGVNTLMDNAKAAALQLAFWDLVVDGGDGLEAGRLPCLQEGDFHPKRVVFHDGNGAFGLLRIGHFAGVDGDFFDHAVNFAGQGH